jgi:2-octaprenyl-6-methoxyphenol hydroxylase
MHAHSAMQPEPIDILIAGGGPVGVALALALQAGGHSVVLTEARGADSSSTNNSKAGDARAIALSYYSRLILERLNAW